jgi:hypothetical protein
MVGNVSPRWALSRGLPVVLLILAVFLLDAPSAHACSCGSPGTVLEAFEEADAVVITRAVSVEKVDGHYVDGVRSTRMVVERVFKGALKVGDEMTFAQGGGADCIWTFNEKSVGERYLFYLHSGAKSHGVWIPIVCGRSTPVQGAADDLLYLTRRDTVAGKTRISGTISFDWETDERSVGLTIKVVGGGRTRDLTTDANGVYEIYDLPAGRYFVEPEVPKGWKVDAFMLDYSSSIDRAARGVPPGRIPIILEAGRHAGLDIQFEPDNAIRGKVVDANGRPMEGVCVDAVPAGDPSGAREFDCTDAEGSFEITELAAGLYNLVANGDGRISSREPFRTLYYPNASRREEAAVLSINPGDVVEGVVITVPKTEETITIEGILRYSNGRPAANEAVKFKAATTESEVEGDASMLTDASGRFSLRILKGLSGKVYADVFVYKGKYVKCPEIEALLRKTGTSSTNVASNTVEVRPDVELNGVELRLPMPGCMKAKLE